MRIDRRRKLPVTTLLHALGMTADDIFDYFYNTVIYKRAKNGWRVPFRGGRMRGLRLSTELINAKTGEIAVEAGTKMTPRLARKLEEEGLTELLVQPSEMAGRYVAFDIIDESNGLVLAEAGQELTEDDIEALAAAKVKVLPTLDVDHVTIGAYIRNTLAVDKNSTREQALVDIYRVMRPGEPPTQETAEGLVNGLFFDSERYDLSAVGRVKLNARLDLEEAVDMRLLHG